MRTRSSEKTFLPAKARGILYLPAVCLMLYAVHGYGETKSVTVTFGSHAYQTFKTTQPGENHTLNINKATPAPNIARSLITAQDTQDQVIWQPAQITTAGSTHTYTMSGAALDEPLWVEIEGTFVKAAGGAGGAGAQRPDFQVTVAKGEATAIAGHGANDGADDATEDARASNTGFTWYPASTGDELLSRLETICGTDEAIGTLVIFSHGYWRGLILEDEKGFYVNTYGLPDAATIDDLAAKIASDDIRFCNPIIKVQACNTGSGTTANFAKRLSEVTDGTVYGATGQSSPEIDGGTETGWFWSSGSAWKKWVDGTEVANSHTTDANLSTPNQYGSNKLRCW